MPLTISIVSQKGGVGKSALARALAVHLTRGGMNVLLADLDFQQSTAFEWAKLRQAYALIPSIQVRPFRTADDALIAGGSADVLVVDGPARASEGTLELARQSDVLIQPSGCGLDDLRPAVLLFHDLLAAGIGREHLLVVLSRTAGEIEEGAARRYLQKARYEIATTSIPERIAFREAMNRGAALMETSDRHLNAHAQGLLDELVKRVRMSAAAHTNRLRKEQVG